MSSASSSLTLTIVASPRRSRTRVRVQLPSRRLTSYRRCGGRISAAIRRVSCAHASESLGERAEDERAGPPGPDRRDERVPVADRLVRGRRPIENRWPAPRSGMTSTVPVGRSSALAMNVTSTSSLSAAASAARPSSSSPTAVTNAAAMAEPAQVRRHVERRAAESRPIGEEVPQQLADTEDARCCPRRRSMVVQGAG